MNHIITFSFDFNDKEVKKALEKQAYDEVIKSIKEDVIKEFASHAPDRYSWGTKSQAERGLKDWIATFLDKYIQEWKDDIIDGASDKLAERLARSKRGKELLNSLEEEQ